MTTKRWVMLGLGVNAHTSVTVGISGLPLIMPDIQSYFGVSLPVAGIICNAPGIGILFSLVLWGVLADRRGEKLVLGLGVGAGAVLFAAVTLVTDIWAVVVLLALAGAAGSAALVGGGRIVLRWFDPPERGVAMGIRQVSFTLGMAIAAFVLPPISRAHGITGVLVLCAVIALVAAVLAVAFLAEPPHAVSDAGPASTVSPYRQPALWRVHAAAALHVAPQFVVSTYGVACLVTVYGWDGVGAGQLFGVAAVAGAAVRILVGRWSDRTGLRMAPLRLLATGSAVVMALLTLGEFTESWLGPAMLALAAVITVAGNGLAYLSAGELAGPGWAGRVLGTHNTIQNSVALAVTPVAGLLITGPGYWAGFAAGLACTLVSLPIIPTRGERHASAEEGVPS
ncbi:MFS transporter [Nonomuraea rhizosphaerae]|uniref:MFS transporter n=1 Tax=Nonomuraea rhizosphaerae TaxID=2665663 RepID=UPI001C5F302F|nr:MFS transporter [Nonomuraea rhizosphaerae]